MIPIDEHLVLAGARKLAERAMPAFTWSELVPELQASFCADFRDAYNAASAEQDLRQDRYHLAAEVYQRGDEWVLQISGVINDTSMTVRHTEPLSVAVEDVPGLPSHRRPEEPEEKPVAVPGL